MATTTNVHNIEKAIPVAMHGFDTVKIACKGDCHVMPSVTLFLPMGTAQAVADAINAAIATDDNDLRDALWPDAAE